MSTPVTPGEFAAIEDGTADFPVGLEAGVGFTRLDAPLVPTETLSEREAYVLRLASIPRTPAEQREVLDFMGYPETLPRGADLVEVIVVRILGARARGERIS